jgi:hypothetical protein
MGVSLGWWSQDLVLVLFGGDDVGCAREYRSGARETLRGSYATFGVFTGAWGIHVKPEIVHRTNNWTGVCFQSVCDVRIDIGGQANESRFSWYRFL